MRTFFLEIVNMSISASWIVLIVLLLRLLLKRASKWITVLLWGIVAIRLICPFSIESVMSLMPSDETIHIETGEENKVVIDTGVPMVNDVVNPVITPVITPVVQEPLLPDLENTHVPVKSTISPFEIIWLVGITVMLVYTLISYWRLKKKIGTAVILRENIYQSESVVSPFVLGVVKPKIYLPFHMDKQDMEHVIAHENAHIRRKDHLWKPFGFLLLTLHWFNPFIWVGYILLCKDIELACDEKVVKELDNQEKADYAQALLNCSVNRRVIAACPIAFGESGVKTRVKSVLNYKKPAFWIIVVGIIASIVVAVCFLTDPVSKDKEKEKEEKTFVEGDLLYDLGATSMEDIDSCTLYDDGLVPEINIGKEDFDIFANYRYKEVFSPIDQLPEVLLWPINRRVNIRINYDDVTLYIPEDGRIVVKPEGKSFLVYEAEEKYRITYEKLDELVEKYSEINTLEGEGANQQTNIEEYYKQFLNGEIPAIENGQEKFLKDYLTSFYKEEDGEYEYTFIDMTGDGIKELCVKNNELYFFTIINGKLYHWCTEGGTYTDLLKNGAIFYERPGGAPNHISYQYYELDENASVSFYIDFAWYYGDEVEEFTGYPDCYYVENKEVSKEEYEEKTTKYLTLGKEKVDWEKGYFPSLPNN